MSEVEDTPITPKKKGFVARVLDNDTVKKVAPSTWIDWLRTNEIYRGFGYGQGKTPPESGDALVQSPYSDWYNMTWGLAPNQDMPKWRWMYRARPEIRRGIDLKVILALGRAFRVECREDEDIEHYANKLLAELKLREILQSAGTDMFVYGQAYFEKVRSLEGEHQEGETVETKPTEMQSKMKGSLRAWASHDMDSPNKEIMKRWAKDIKAVDQWLALDTRLGVSEDDFKESTGELIELKPLDPLWMRINRDAFNNVTGFVQWGLEPIPQSLLASKIIFMRWMPKSWSHESAYGTSLLMPIQRHISMLIQAEEDMKIYWHQYAKPMLVVKAGTSEKPYPVPKLQSLRTAFAGRQPNTDAVVPGDVDVNVMSAGTGETTSSFDSWGRYLREKIYEELGIPNILMNLQAAGSRAANDISLQAFIAEEQMLQQMIGEQFMDQVILPEVRRRFPSKFKKGMMPVIKIVWPPVLEEDRNKKMDRSIKATGAPFMTINEAREEVGLEAVDDEKYDQIIDLKVQDTAPGAQVPSPEELSDPEESESIRTGPREEELQKRDREAIRKTRSKIPSSKNRNSNKAHR